MNLDKVCELLNARISCLSNMINCESRCNFPDCDDCILVYEQGTIGEQREALEEALSIIRQEYY